MALHRGIQSAVFYYLSCAPCTGYSYRKKRRKEATRDRADKAALEEELPGLYRHPSPFATNPNWQTEIDLGPRHGPTNRKKDKKAADNAWALQSLQTHSSVDGGSNIASSSDLAGIQAERNDSRLNIRRYQREDEELWGNKGLDPSSRRLKGSNLDGSGSAVAISRPATARTNKTAKSASSYQGCHNPQINDLHPAIITKTQNKEDVMWMLQPPPAARVMLGKDRASRSRSDSGGSRLSSRKGPDENLARQVSQRLMGEKMRRSETNVSRPVSRSKAKTEEQSKHPKLAPGIIMDDSSPSDDDEPLPTRRQKRKRKPVNVSEDSAGSNATVIRRPASRTSSTPDLMADPDSPLITKASLRPALATINSDSSPSPSPRPGSPSRSRHTINQSSDSSRDRNARRPPILTGDSSLNVLQEVIPTSTLLNLKNRGVSKAPSFEARIRLPPADSREDLAHKGWDARYIEDGDDVDGESGFMDGKDFDGKEWRFPQWAAERVTRNVSHRWSMDI